MKTSTPSKLVSAFTIITFIILCYSCKKDSAVEIKTLDFSLPILKPLTYGDQQNIALPKSLTEVADMDLSLSFDQTENVSLSSGIKLHDRMAQALTLDKKSGSLLVNSTLLYPNDASSSTNNNKIPEVYKITLKASSRQAAMQGEHTMDLIIKPDILSINGLNNEASVPYAYVLYNEPDVTYQLISKVAADASNSWYLRVNSTGNPPVTLDGDKIRVNTAAGDPAQKEEKSYELSASLLKDGYAVAVRDFKLTYIPQIKFFYGNYYPEYDLTLYLNQLHIALGKAYRSSAPTLYPAQYKGGYRILSIKKDGILFNDESDVFDIDEKSGSVTVKANEILSAGKYTFNVEAVTTTGRTFITDLSLNLAPLSE